VWASEADQEATRVFNEATGSIRESSPTHLQVRVVEGRSQGSIEGSNLLVGQIREVGGRSWGLCAACLTKRGVVGPWGQFVRVWIEQSAQIVEDVGIGEYNSQLGEFLEQWQQLLKGYWHHSQVLLVIVCLIRVL
jgi:hypothetical protein